MRSRIRGMPVTPAEYAKEAAGRLSLHDGSTLTGFGASGFMPGDVVSIMQPRYGFWGRLLDRIGLRRPRRLYTITASVSADAWTLGA